MYAIYTLKDTIRVPPKNFAKNLKDSIQEILREEYEGLVDDSVGVFVSIVGVKKIGEGKVIPGDGSAYYETEFEVLTFSPQMQEAVEGYVSEITEFGAFVRTGPVEGLVHVSQIMNDYINYDAKMPGFVGKESKKKLTMEDHVLARIVSVSLKGNIPNSKIGLTMRQEGLGKKEWIEYDLKKQEKKKKAPEKGAKKGEKK